MLVRAIRTHYHNTLRKEGQEWDHEGPLYKHIEPVEPQEDKQPGKTGKGKKPVD